MATEDLLKLSRYLLDRTPTRHRRIKINQEATHRTGQAQGQEPGCRTEHREGVQSTRRDRDRRAGSEVDCLVFNLDNQRGR